MSMLGAKMTVWPTSVVPLAYLFPTSLIPLPTSVVRLAYLSGHMTDSDLSQSQLMTGLSIDLKYKTVLNSKFPSPLWK